jgi:hemin uptake protein HemP
MKEITLTKEDLPIKIVYNGKEYILKATPKGIVLVKKEY